jgi:hypothetical protein
VSFNKNPVMTYRWWLKFITFQFPPESLSLQM